MIAITEARCAGLLLPMVDVPWLQLSKQHRMIVFTCARGSRNILGAISIMRIFFVAAACLLLAGCNETASQTGPSATSDSSYRTADNTQPGELPPIYEPLIDMNRVNPAKYRADLAECRQLAAPQEQAARQARAQQSKGTALQVAGAMANIIPVGGLLASAGDAAQSVGGATAGNAAMTADQATADYALVVNTCLGHKHYRILR